VDHLVHLGHRRIAFFWHGKEMVPSARARRDGFLAAVQAAGSLVSADEFTDKNASTLMAALHRKDGPTGVFCYNDELAVHLLDLCHEASLRIPEDISIVGFDDNILAVTARPQLTTVTSPLTEMARVAVELVKAQIRGEPPPPHPVLLPPSLTIRDSCGVPSQPAL
jgi:LacI family transcriptional regulator